MARMKTALGLVLASTASIRCGPSTAGPTRLFWITDVSICKGLQSVRQRTVAGDVGRLDPTVAGAQTGGEDGVMKWLQLMLAAMAANGFALMGAKVLTEAGLAGEHQYHYLLGW